MRTPGSSGVRIRPSWMWTAGLLLAALVALGVPLTGLLYVALLLACPLMMLLMHGGGHGPAQDHAHGEGRAHGNGHGPTP